MSTAVALCKAPRGRLALSARQSLASVADLTRIELVEEESLAETESRSSNSSPGQKGHARSRGKKRHPPSIQRLAKWVLQDAWAEQLHQMFSKPSFPSTRFWWCNKVEVSEDRPRSMRRYFGKSRGSWKQHYYDKKQNS